MLVPAQIVLLLLAQAATYSVSGRVTFDDGEPLAGAEVYASPHGYDPVGEIVQTDSEGRFNITDLPKGFYMLSAARDDMGAIVLGQTPQPQVAIGFNLSEKFPHLDFVYHVSRPVTISGAVRTSTGATVSQAEVWAVRRIWINGKASLQSPVYAVPDDRGRFRLPHLTRGRWSVCAILPPAHPALPVGVARFGEKSSAVFIKACYPEDSSSFVKLSPGQNLDINLVFRPTYPAAISGRILNTDGYEPASAVIIPESGVPMFPALSPENPDTHSFRIPNVLPGRYRVFAQASEPGKPGSVVHGTSKVIDVADSDQSVELTLAPPPRITATIHAPPHAGKIVVSLRSADDPDGTSYDAAAQPDGSLLIPVPDPGRYWLVTRADLCNSGARLESSGSPGESDVRSQAIQITPGMHANLDVTFSSNCGEVRGVVVDSSGNPVPNARHLILLSGSPSDPGDVFEDSAGEDGAFYYSGLAPGKYVLWAWSSEDEWDGVLENLRDLAPQQTVVEILPQQTVTIKLPLIRSSQ